MNLKWKNSGAAKHGALARSLAFANVRRVSSTMAWENSGYRQYMQEEVRKANQEFEKIQRSRRLKIAILNVKIASNEPLRKAIMEVRQAAEKAAECI